MLPDPLDLRAAATALAAAADQARARCGRVGVTWGAVRWHCHVADVVGAELAAAEASAAASWLDLQAGAAHLRLLASLVEQVRAAAARLHAAAEQGLRAVAAVPAASAPPAGGGAPAVAGQQSGDAVPQPPPQGPAPRVAAAQEALAALPGPDDPSWAERAGARPVALPARAVVPARQVAPSPPGLVEADVDGVRGLARDAIGGADELLALSGSVAARVGGLGLASLDAYGMAGSRSAEWLQACGGAGSGLAAAARAWASAASTAARLAELLGAADGSTALLTDPRLPLALDVFGALRAGDAAGALRGVAPADRAWLARVVPGLDLPGPAAQPEASWLSQHWTQVGGWVNEVVTAPALAAEELHREVSRLASVGAERLRSASALTGPLAAQARAAGRAVLDEAREVRALAQRADRITAALRVPKVVTRLTGSAVSGGRVLRHLPWMSVIGSGVDLVQDLRHGTSPGKAVLHLAEGVGMTIATGAVTAAVVAALPVEIAALAAAGVSITVALGANWAVQHVGPWAVGVSRRAAEQAGQLVGRASSAVSSAASSAASSATWAISSAASSASSAARGAADRVGAGARSATGAAARAARRWTSWARPSWA